jgi:NADH dehydrogenase
MSHRDKIVTIFGGAGFIGSHIAQDLAREGFRLKIITRAPESAYELKTYGSVGQIVATSCDFSDEKSIQQTVKGSYAVINLIGILYEKRKNKFKKVHTEIPAAIAKACQKENVKKFIHISALGVDKGGSKYARSKREGEAAVKEAYKNVTILRPSVVFGPGDSFFNMFAKLAIFLPVLPLIGGGKTKFQPVYVGDIAEAIRNIVVDYGDEYQGRTYQLGGPEVVSFKEIYQRLFKVINREPALISLPWWLASLQGALMSLLPKPPLTADQVRSLKVDNVVAPEALTLTDLGVNPTPMSGVLPQYLACYKKGGRFGDKKAA